MEEESGEFLDGGEALSRRAGTQGRVGPGFLG